MESSERQGLFVLSSANSLETFPNNTASDFANLLPQEIKHVSSNKKYYIKLLGIAISARTTHDLGIVSVHLQQLEPQKAGTSVTQVLATFPFPPTRNLWTDNYALHTFKNSVLLPLKLEELEYLHVRLTDEYEQKIVLESHYPTVLWFEITDKSMEGQFNMACTSRQPNLYPNNQLGDFIVPLPSEMSLPDYEVALLNVVFPAHLSEEEREVSFTVEDDEFVFDLNTYTTTQEFVQDVKDQLLQSAYRDMLIFDTVFGGENDGCAFFHMMEMALRHELSIKPSPAFTAACGQVQMPRARTILTRGSFFTFQGTPNIFLAKSHPLSMVECSIIQTTVTSGDFANLLQFVPILKNEEKSKMYEPDAIVYHSVVNRPFNAIRFTFKEPNGAKKIMSSWNPEDFILINLSFKRKNE